MAVLFVVIVLIAIDDRLIVRFRATPLIRQVAAILALLAGGWICYRGAQVTLNGIEMIRRGIRGR